MKLADDAPLSGRNLASPYKNSQCAGFIPQDVGDDWINPPLNRNRLKSEKFADSKDWLSPGQMDAGCSNSWQPY